MKPKNRPSDPSRTHFLPFICNFTTNDLQTRPAPFSSALLTNVSTSAYYRQHKVHNDTIGPTWRVGKEQSFSGRALFSPSRTPARASPSATRFARGIFNRLTTKLSLNRGCLDDERWQHSWDDIKLLIPNSGRIRSLAFRLLCCLYSPMIQS